LLFDSKIKSQNFLAQKELLHLP